ncbi:hypothetical protein ACKRZS_006378 [Fusarium odoratissimum]
MAVSSSLAFLHYAHTSDREPSPKNRVEKATAGSPHANTLGLATERYAFTPSSVVARRGHHRPTVMADTRQ